jgi:peptidoglycan/LPS O-acetylase OafA/YrhL
MKLARQEGSGASLQQRARMRRVEAGKVAMDKPEIRALTGVRGVAACLVAIYHFSPTKDMAPGPLHNVVGRGYLWVDLFFVLSGFVIALNYGHLFAAGFSRRAFATFLTRRVARIYPLYLVVLLAGLIWGVVTSDGFHATGDAVASTPSDVIQATAANLTMVQSWGISGSIVGTAWSISTEWAAYLGFPLIAGVALFGRRFSAASVGLLAIALLASVSIWDNHDAAYHSGALDAYDGTSPVPLMRCLAGFGLGILTYRATRLHAMTELLSQDRAGIALIGMLIVALVGGAPDLVVVALFPPLVLCLSANQGIPARLFSYSAMFRLGTLSYAIYLLHPFFQRPAQLLATALADVLPDAAAVLLAAALIGGALLAASVAAYVWIERPGRTFLRRVEARHSRQQPIASLQG